MSKLKNAGIYLAIASVSVILVLAWGGFQRDAFLIDDNRTQWFPVIEKAYEDFFETGTMPFYNFYLEKGLAIGEPGYYSITNPFMMLAYLISHYLPLGFSTVTVYICLQTMLGNLFFYKLCRDIKCSHAVSATATAAYFSCSAFCENTIWYYIFVNYMFVPLLLWAFIRFRGTKYEYFGCGVILAFDLLMGNVQYTCYHYMVFCLTCATMVFFKELKYIKVMLTNIAVGIILSLPFFGMLIKSSDGFTNHEFMVFSIGLFDLLINSVVPWAVIDAIGGNTVYTTPNLILMKYMGGIVAAMIVCLTALVIQKIRAKRDEGSSLREKRSSALQRIGLWALDLYKRICSSDFYSKTFAAIVVTLVFFLFVLNGGFIAYLLKSIPVINKFRYLFKTLFVIVPLLAAIMAYILAKQKQKIKAAALAVSIVFSVAGFVNNYFVISSNTELYCQSQTHSFEEEKEIADGHIESTGIDIKNYRTICLFRDDYIKGDEHSNLLTTTFMYYENMSRNFMAYNEAFSLCAYEMSTPEDRLQQFDKIYDSEFFFTVYANAGKIGYFSDSLTECPQELEAQLISNSVKYILVENTNIKYSDGVDYTSEIVELFENLENVKVLRIGQYSQKYDLIELDGVNSLCVDENGGFTELVDDNMDLLHFAAGGSDSYKLSFAYDKNLKAFLTNGGEKTILEITEAEDGNAVIRTNGATGEVYLTYDSALCTAAVVMEIVITAAFIALIVILIYLSVRKNKEA